MGAFGELVGEVGGGSGGGAGGRGGLSAEGWGKVKDWGYVERRWRGAAGLGRGGGVRWGVVVGGVGLAVVLGGW